MEKEVERLVKIWKNDFALTYKDKPRLYNLITRCKLDIREEEIEPGVNMLFVIFFARNEVQRTWIKQNVIFEMQDRFAQMAKLEQLTVGVGIDESEEAIYIIENPPHPPVVLTENDTIDFGLDFK